MNEPELHDATIDEADPDASATLLVVVVGTILVVAVVVFVQGMYERVSRGEFQRKVVAESPLELQQLQTGQRLRLQGMTWVDKREGIVTIPIEEAMALVVREAAGSPAAPERRP